MSETLSIKTPAALVTAYYPFACQFYGEQTCFYQLENAAVAIGVGHALSNAYQASHLPLLLPDQSCAGYHDVKAAYQAVKRGRKPSRLVGLTVEAVQQLYQSEAQERAVKLFAVIRGFGAYPRFAQLTLMDFCYQQDIRFVQRYPALIHCVASQSWRLAAEVSARPGLSINHNQLIAAWLEECELVVDTWPHYPDNSAHPYQTPRRLQ